MEQTLNRVNVRHISLAADEIVDYIKKRKTGHEHSLRTRWKKFNDTCMGGIEPNIIITIGGRSGSGKSSIANSLQTDLFDLNPGDDIVMLVFNFEMLQSRNVGRTLSYKLKKTTSHLYSAVEGEAISEQTLFEAQKIAEDIKKYNIYYVDSPCNVLEMSKTIDYFQQNVAKNKWLVIILDHTLLVRGMPGEEERITLANLQRMFIEKKKIGKTTIIQLSQLNRNVESPERLTNPALHFPTSSDLFGGDTVYHTSDYVMVLSRPETVGIKAYGVNRWPVQNYIYMHIIKNREGACKILQFLNNLQYNSIEDVAVTTTK